MPAIYKNGINYSGGIGSGGDGVEIVEMTMAEYEALSESVKLNGACYFITDADDTIPLATEVSNGLMSADDKKLISSKVNSTNGAFGLREQDGVFETYDEETSAWKEVPINPEASAVICEDGETVQEKIDTKLVTKEEVGSLEDLETVETGSIVDAINSLKTALEGVTGSLSNLETTDKTTIVAAIDELKTVTDSAVKGKGIELSVVDGVLQVTYDDGTINDASSGDENTDENPEDETV